MDILVEKGLEENIDDQWWPEARRRQHRWMDSVHGMDRCVEENEARRDAPQKYRYLDNLM